MIQDSIMTKRKSGQYKIESFYSSDSFMGDAEVEWYVREIKTGRVVWTPSGNSEPLGVEFSDDGKQLKVRYYGFEAPDYKDRYEYYPIDQLEQPRMVTGRAYAYDGKTPIAGLTVNIRGRGSSLGQSGFATTDAQGDYQVEVPPGSYEATVSAGDDEVNTPAHPMPSNFDNISAASPRSVTGPTQWDMVLPQSITISGQVTGDKGVPVSDTKISATENTGNVVCNSITDANGNYSIILFRGTYDFKVSPPSNVKPTWYVPRNITDIAAIKSMTYDIKVGKYKKWTFPTVS
jgi:hypothetical protein